MADRFPKDFLWGASSSALQTEGGWDEGGKGMTMTDHNSFKRSHKQADSKVVSDLYSHWKEDIALMRELGTKIYRFSLSWACIIPNGDGKVNQQGIAFYNNAINYPLEYGIQPFVTLCHFDLPYALVERYNGWEDRWCVYTFERYAKICFGQYGDRVKYWRVINEQNLVAHVNERMDINEADPLKADRIRAQMGYRMLLAYALTPKACHELVKDGRVGPAVSSIYTYLLTNKPEDVWVTRANGCMRTAYCLGIYYYRRYPGYYMRHLSERGIVPVMMGGDKETLKHGRMDYITLNYYRILCTNHLPADGSRPVGVRAYRGNEVGFNRHGYYRDEKNESLVASEYDAQIDPIELCIVLNDYCSRYHVPLIITESGLGMGDELTVGNQIHDPYRVDYIRGHLKTCSLMTQDGVDLMGYPPWSFMGLLGSHQGFRKRYGSMYIDREDIDLEDLTRIKEGSFYWYQNVIQTDGEKL